MIVKQNCEILMEVEKEVGQIGESSKEEGIYEKSSENLGTLSHLFC